MNSPDLRNSFFFDLALSDVYGSGCSALRLIYHGSEQGAFAKKSDKAKQPIALEDVKAFQIGLNHRTVSPLSDDYDYNLVYYRKEFAEAFWDGKIRKGCPTLRKITRRVKFSQKQSLKPKRLKLFYIKSNRPVHVARYSDKVPTDNYVPAPYLAEFGRSFGGFLMRCPKGYALVSNLFAAQGLAVSDQRQLSEGADGRPRVRAYAAHVA
ncbi:MAG: hypothetical protein QM496_10375 [Verrucomicrobiota bacterium]